MAFITDKEVLKSGLIIFRRGDVEHRNFYFFFKLPKEDRYKTISLQTSDRESARDRAIASAPRSSSATSRCASGSTTPVTSAGRGRCPRG